MEGPFVQIAKGLVILGMVIAAVGLLLLFLPKLPFIGKLPGDIYIKRDNFSFYFPITTCIIITSIISLIVYIFRR